MEHLLFGLPEQGKRHGRLCCAPGLKDVNALVDVAYPVTLPPMNPDVVERLALAARMCAAPSPEVQPECSRSLTRSVANPLAWPDWPGDADEARAQQLARLSGSSRTCS